MKEEFRKKILGKKKLISKDDILSKSTDLAKNLFDFNPFNESKNVMFFVSFGKEPNTHLMIERVLESKTIVVPKVFGDNLMPCKISSIDELIKSSYGALEPIEEDLFPVNKIDLVLVPGLAFTEKGHRIGYGIGYFDRFLKKSSALRVGVCFEEFIVDNLPIEEHDINVDAVITDKRTIIVEDGELNV